MQVQQALNEVRDEFELPAFQNYVPDWYAASQGEKVAATDRDAALAKGDVWLADLAENPKTFNA